MHAIVCSNPGSLLFTSVETPARGQGHTLIKIRRIGICGTDLHAFDGSQPFFTYPRILGHELCGEITEADPDSPYSRGDLVTVLPYLHCGTCIACRNGKPNCCVGMQVLGVHIDGGMVEYLSIPTSHIMYAGDLSPDALALVEPLSVSSHGIRRAGVSAGEFVLVAGAGPIGIGAMDLARIAGARVIALDVDPHRLDFCIKEIGVEFAFDARDPDLLINLQRVTRNEMAPVVIDATGNLRAINNGFNYISHGGRYVLIGLQKEAITFSHPEFHKREATLMSSRNATERDFTDVISMMRMKQLVPEKYITGRMDFSVVQDKFSTLNKAGDLNIKTMIDMD
ncbi:MAG: zinc-binding alcohol dehydrogenase family protein [Chitinophagaceae bacterium]|nr:MAG: zinc-binding alcohol dehydrogenase family protein [Chitinophagaceae bacterium]